MKSTFSMMFNGHTIKKRLFGYPIATNEQRNCYKPIFIVGSGRSGTTLLRRILFSHPVIYIPPENHGLVQAIRAYKLYRRHSWKDIIEAFIESLSMFEDFHLFELKKKDLALTLDRIPDRMRSLASLIDGFYRYCGYAKKIEFLQWGDKTPLNVYYLDQISEVFPRAKILHMIRDGADVVESYLRVGRYSSIEDAACRWTTSVKCGRLFGMKRPGSYHEIRYEDLVLKPKQTVMILCKFLKIEYKDSIIESEAAFDLMGDTLFHDHYKKVKLPISPVNIGMGRKRLEGKQLIIFENIAGHVLNELGYERLF